MSPRKFDRFMVDVHIASNPKLARLTVQERWCHVAGILSLAALSPIRGHLLIGHDPVELGDIARRAGVSVAVARSTVEKLRKVGVLERDPDVGCDVVHDFEDWNPPPKTDPTNAQRQKRYRDRRNGVSNATVTRVTAAPVTPPEVKGREEKRTPPLPPIGGRARDKVAYEGELAEFTRQHFPGLDPGYVKHFAAQLRRSDLEPTIEALTPLVTPYLTVEAHS